MQLVAIGAQDKFLIENPKVSFYKTVYFRHTNFSIESIENYFNGNPKLGSKLTSTIARNGDLLKNLWLEVDMEGDLCNSTGHSLIEFVELEVGGQIIDTQYGEWMEVLSELTLPEEKRLGYNKMVNKTNRTSNSTIVFVTYEGTGTRSISSGGTGNADVIYCKLSDGTNIGQYDLHTSSNSIDLVLEENKEYMFDFDDRTHPETGDVQFVFTVNNVEVKHRETVKMPSMTSLNENTKVEIFNVLPDANGQYKKENRENTAKLTFFYMVRTKQESEQHIADKKENPPVLLYPPIVNTTLVSSSIVKDGVFTITIPFVVINSQNTIVENVKIIISASSDMTVTKINETLDVSDPKVTISVNLSDLDKGVEYNGTMINIMIDDSFVDDYTIPAEVSSIGYIPTDEEISTYDYIVTNTYSGAYTFYGLGENPSLTLTKSKEYKFLLIDLGDHPFKIIDTATSFEVGSSAPRTDSSGDQVRSDQIYTFTPDINKNYIYQCTNHTNMFGSIDFDILQPIFENRFLNITTKSIRWRISQLESSVTDPITLSVSITGSNGDIINELLNFSDDITEDLTFNNLSPGVTYTVSSLSWKITSSTDDPISITYMTFQDRTTYDEPDIDLNLISRTSESITWEITRTRHDDKEEMLSDDTFIITGKIKLQGSQSSDTDVQQSVRFPASNLLTFNNLTEGQTYEVYDLQWSTVDGDSGSLDITLQGQTDNPPDILPTFDNPLHTVTKISNNNNNISFTINQTNPAFTDSITLEGMIATVHPHEVHATLIYSDSNNIMTFEGCFDGFTYSVKKLSWKLTSSTDIPVDVVDLSFFPSEITIPP